MKKLFISLALGFMLVFGGSAYANGNHEQNSHHNHGHETNINNYDFGLDITDNSINQDVDVNQDVEVDVDVNNTNVNMNSNTNLNLVNQDQDQEQAQDQSQDQAQGQDQGQLQGQSQETEQANVQETNITTIVERDFHNSAVITTPDMVTSNTDTMNWNVQRTGDILWIKSTWSRYHLKKMLGSNYSLKSASRTLVNWNSADEIEIILDISKDVNFSLLGTVSVRGNGADETFDCLYKAALDALDMGANTLLVTGEGIGKILKSFSWGIGFNVSQASMTDDGKSRMATGGLGISSGSSSYKSEPWVHALALYIYNK